MKLVIIEPLGVDEEKLMAMAKEALGSRVEIVYYPTRTTDTKDLIERGKDADVIAVSNLPLNSEVIDGCKSLSYYPSLLQVLTILQWMRVRKMVLQYVIAPAIRQPPWQTSSLVC